MKTLFKLCASCALGFSLFAMIMLIAGCGNDNNNQSASSVSNGSITSGSNGAATGSVAAPTGINLTLNNSVLSDASTPPAPVVGPISTTVLKSESVSALPTAAQTLPADRQLALFIDITMGTVKNIAPPMVAIVAVPAGVTTVDVYSFNGTTWVLEQSDVAVSGGNATFNINHLSIWGIFTKTSAAGDTTPDAFSFTAQTNVALNTSVTSNAITVAGINAAAPISITGGTYSIDGGPFTSAAGTVTNGQTIRVQHTSSVANGTAVNTTLTIGGVSSTFTSTTISLGTVDTTPDAFSFTAQSNVALNIPVTSDAITVTGINAAAPISITGGTYSIDGGPFTSAAGTVTNGQTVRVQHTSPATNGAAANTTLTIGGVSSTFTSTTIQGVVDTTPDAFTFTALANAALNTPVISNAITVAGINAATPISITGGTYSIDGGPFTSVPGTVTNGQTVRVQHTSSAANGTAVNTTLTIGGVTSTFTSTTLAGAGVNAASLYQSRCAGCHSLGTVDTTGGPNLLGKNASARFPTPGVVAHQGISLTAQEIAALTAYFLAP